MNNWTQEESTDWVQGEPAGAGQMILAKESVNYVFFGQSADACSAKEEDCFSPRESLSPFGENPSGSETAKN